MEPRAVAPVVDCHTARQQWQPTALFVLDSPFHCSCFSSFPSFPPLRRPQITFPALPPLRFCGEQPLRKPDSRHAGSRLCLFASPFVCPSPHHLAGRALTLFSRRHSHRWTLSVLRMFPVAPLSHTTQVFPRLFTAIVIAAITTARAMSWRPLGK